MALHPTSNVIAQIIEGDAVVINLENGCYFTFNTPGTDVWAGVESGGDIASISAYLCARYGISAEQALDATEDFVRSLTDNQLVQDDGLPGGNVVSDMPPPPPFDDPSLQKYDDMQDLILLDPVHEVDEQQGWPHARQEA